MDFSKKGTTNKQQQIKSTSRKLTSKFGVTFFRIFLLSIVFLVIIGSFAGFGVLKGLADSAPAIDQINVVPSGFTTNIYDKDGEIIQSLVGAEANRVYVGINEIPKVLSDCVLSIEDERFYEHNGIDMKGIFRAFFVGISKGDFDEGASTITQQLIKNQVFNGGAEDNFMDRAVRKIQEQYLAIQLEDQLEKDEILEYYLNNINLGAGTYGVQTASKRYFNKEVKDLTLSESAVIAAIAQSPTNMNPINHPDNNAGRRSLILDNMKRLGWCTEEEYNEAIADDVYSRIQTVNEETGVTSFYSYFVDELIEQVIEDLQNKRGYTYTQASNILYSGGLSIYTTLDSNIQSILDSVYSDESYFPEVGKYSYWELTYALSIEKADETTIHYHTNDLLEHSGLTSAYFSTKEDAQEVINAFKTAKIESGDTILGEKSSLIIQPQSSMVIMDQTTGQVVGLIGGRGDKVGNRTLNRATNTSRQPGSTFKVLSTYLPALDSAGMTLATVMDDSPYKYPGTDKYVNNWDKTGYNGLTTLRDAITNSMNIVTVKTLAAVTPQVGFDYLLKLGFTTMVDSRTSEDGKVFSDINLPMALGGITDGVTNLELTAAYAAIANSGIYTTPTFYTKILDHDNKVLLSSEPTVRKVMMESTAYLLTSAMEDVVKKGTGKSINFRNINMSVAGKTGTTSDEFDLWFSGYTPYYTATIWSGFDNNKKQTEKSYQKVIWRDVMEQIHQYYELETVPFTKPNSIVTAQICTKSGKLAVEGLCDQYVGGSTVRTEYFAKGSVPAEKCDIHTKVTICKDSGKIANEYCPESSLVEKVYLSKEESSKTADSEYLLPTEICDIHNASTKENTLPTIPVKKPNVTSPPVITPTITPPLSDGNTDSWPPEEDEEVNDVEFYYDYGD